MFRSLLLVATLLALPVLAAEVPQAPPADIALGHAILKELVETNTTHALGSSVAAHELEARLIAAGYSHADVVFLAPADHPAKGNLVVRVHGRDPGQKPVLFIGHLDVVEARAEDWSVDPFRLTQKDGYFYGRGSMDMKDGDAVLADSLIRLKREGWVPDRDLIFAFTADEEAGGDANGPAFLLRSHRTLVDAGVVINFDGGGGELRHGRPFVYGVDTAEKVYLTFRVEATSPGGHGSLPIPGNPIERISAGLVRLAAYHFPVVTTATTRAGFAFEATLEQGSKREDLMAVSREPPDLAAAERLSREVGYNAELRTTCVPTLISGGHAENALPQRAQATIQCRMMPSDNAADVENRIRTALADSEIALRPDVAAIQAPESPLQPAVMNRIETVVHTLWPGVPVVPAMATGFSDGRQFRGAGMATYSAGGEWFEQGENRAHGRDERVGVESFDQNLEYAYLLVKAFGRKD